MVVIKLKKMIKKTKEKDPLFEILIKEFTLDEIKEVEKYLNNDIDNYDIGFGDVLIEPFDEEKNFLSVKHNSISDIVISNTILKNIMYDLKQELIKKKN